MAEHYRQNVGVEFAPLQDELILFHASSNRFCVLNRTSSFIWSELKQPVTIEEIACRLGNSFSGVSPQQAVSDVDSTLQQMLALGLVVSVDTGANHQTEAKR